MKRLVLQAVGTTNTNQPLVPHRRYIDGQGGVNLFSRLGIRFWTVTIFKMAKNSNEYQRPTYGKHNRINLPV